MFSAELHNCVNTISKTLHGANIIHSTKGTLGVRPVNACYTMHTSCTPLAINVSTVLLAFVRTVISSG